MTAQVSSPGRKADRRKRPSADGSLAELAADRLDGQEPSADLKTAVGQEVRFWRNHRGLTGARLAAMAGVSAGMLTKIEKGDVAPSIQTLVKISDALEVPTSMFFHRLHKRPSVNFVPAGKGLVTDRSGNRGNQIYELLAHNLHHTMGIEPFMVTMDDKAEPYPMLQEEGFKFLHMMAGEVIYRHGHRTFHLRPGDSLTFDAMAPHGAEKLLSDTATWLSVGFYPHVHGRR